MKISSSFVVQRSNESEFSKDLAGVKNFRYMFNELPKHKQTGAIKSLEKYLEKRKII